jgi:hypothetical protein
MVSWVLLTQNGLSFIINEIVTQNKTTKQKNNIWRLFVVDLLMRTFSYLALAWLYLIINLLKLFIFQNHGRGLSLHKSVLLLSLSLSLSLSLVSYSNSTQHLTPIFFIRLFFLPTPERKWKSYRLVSNPKIAMVTWLV